MSGPDSLKEVYTDELQDLWSANDQMTKAVTAMAAEANDPKLKQTFEKSISGIGKHTETLKALLEDAGSEVEKDHCKGMEGLVKEALKHSLKKASKDGDLQDLVMIAQYQRMSHYGITGFGTATSYAMALGMKDHVTKLRAIVSDIYQADEYASKLGEKAANAALNQE
ncbi:MAG: ferritin-like domain-containing protein [Proteobacteria bacterium]|nr:MAG: ferritin-like domain-containing protein [Pseudomonadota bacterium]